jgi:hypothetical protein
MFNQTLTSLGTYAQTLPAWSTVAEDEIAVLLARAESGPARAAA